MCWGKCLIQLWCASFSLRWPLYLCHMSLLILTFSKSVLCQLFSWVPNFEMALWLARGLIFWCIQHYVHHCHRYHRNHQTTTGISIRTWLPLFLSWAPIMQFRSNAQVITSFFGVPQFAVVRLLFIFWMFLFEMLAFSHVHDFFNFFIIS